MRIHLVNPSDVSFGTAVITPRWQYVLAAATPARHGTPLLIDETLEPIDEGSIQAGDVVGIGIHTGNALRGYHIGQTARARGAFVVFGGIHATLFPDEVREHGGAHAGEVFAQSQQLAPEAQRVARQQLDVRERIEHHARRTGGCGDLHDAADDVVQFHVAGEKKE